MIEKGLFKRGQEEIEHARLQKIEEESKSQLAQDINMLKTQQQVDQNQYTIADRIDSKNKIIQSKIFKSQLTTYKQENQITQKRNSDESDLPLQSNATNFRSQMTIISSKRWQYVASFIQKIKQESSKYRFTLSRKQQLDIIDDKSFNYNYFYFQQKFINDDHLPNRLWNFLQFISLFTYIIYLPIRLAFDALYHDPTILFFFEQVPNIIQIINIFVQFNTGFYKRGMVITDRQKIFKNYFSHQFLFEFILAICWLISLNENVSLWFKVIGILRLITFITHLTQLEQTTKVREYIGSYVDLLKLGGFIFLCAHLTGCCWYALAIYQNHIGISNTWLDNDIIKYEIEKEIDSVVQGYIASFYWAIITMCTVGYGDIGPTTYRERIFVVFICLLASFLFAFSMNSIGEIIKNLRQNNEEFKEQTTALNMYMDKRKLSKQLKMRVRKYYEYLFVEKKQENELGSQLIENLAPSLKNDVLKEMYTNILKKEKMFYLNFSDKFISQLFTFVKERKYSVDEYLFRENEHPQSIFFILQGEVEILLQNDLILQTLSQGEFVGQQEFFADNPYTFSAKVNTFTQFLVIDKNDFLGLLQNYERDYERYCQIKDSANLYRSTSSLCKKCESCNSYGHTFQGCQMIQFHSNKHKQIFNYNQLKQLTRQPWERRNINPFPTLMSLKEIGESVKGFHEHIQYMQQQKEEHEGNRLKNFETIDDDSDYEDSENDSAERNNFEQEQKIIYIKDICLEQEQKQNEQHEVESRNHLVNLQNSDDLSYEEFKQTKNNSQCPINQQLPIHQFPLNQTPKKQNSKQITKKSSSIFAREQHEKEISLENSSNESEIYDINNPVSPEVKSINSSNKKNQTVLKPDNNGNNNAQMSYFFQYAIKDSDCIKGATKIDNKQQKDNDNFPPKSNAKKNNPSSKTNSPKLPLLLLQQQHQQQEEDGNHSGSMKRIENILITKLFKEKNNQLRRQSRYMPSALFNKQVSLQLSETNSPGKKMIMSPKNQMPIPNIHQTLILSNKTPTMTPKQQERRGTMRNGTQLSSSLASMVQFMYEQAAEQENIVKKKPFQNFDEVENDFDLMKEYQKYFQNNNLQVVIDKSNKIIQSNIICQEFLREKSIRKKKKGVTTKTRYEKKNFNLLHKRIPSAQKHYQQGTTFKKTSVDWSKAAYSGEKLPRESSKQEFDSLIKQQDQNQNNI